MKFILLTLFSFFVYGTAHAADPSNLRPVYRIGVAMAATTITTAAYVELDSEMDSSCTALDVFNSGANPIYLAIGPASSESPIPYLIPISMTHPVRVNIAIKKGVRLSARSLSADVTTGFLIINCLQ